MKNGRQIKTKQKQILIGKEKTNKILENHGKCETKQKHGEKVK